MRLADFFDVELGDLVEGSRVERSPLEVIRDGEGSVLASSTEGITTRFLGHQRWQLSPRVTDYEAGGTLEIAGGEQAAREILHHRELFIYIVTGTFEITVHGEEPVKLSRGDAVLIRDGADRVVNTGRRAGRLLIVGVTLGSWPARVLRAHLQKRRADPPSGPFSFTNQVTFTENLCRIPLTLNGYAL